MTSKQPRPPDSPKGFAGVKPTNMEKQEEVRKLANDLFNAGASLLGLLVSKEKSSVRANGASRDQSLSPLHPKFFLHLCLNDRVSLLELPGLPVSPSGHGAGKLGGFMWKRAVTSLNSGSMRRRSPLRPHPQRKQNPLSSQPPWGPKCSGHEVGEGLNPTE